MTITYGEAVLDKAVSGKAIPDLCSLHDFLIDVTTRKTRREPTMMDELVAEALREPGPTRRWFLKAGLSIGAVAFMSAFPGAPVNAAGTTFFVATTGDNSDGTTWAKAKTTITTGIAVCGIGDYLLVDATYSVTATAAVTWTPPAGGLAIISVTPNGASGFSAFTAGAVEAVGAANSAFSIVGVSSAAFYLNGLVVTGGTNNSGNCVINLMITSNVNSYMEAVGCKFTLPSIATVNILFGPVAGSANTALRLRNCTFEATGSRAGNLILLGECTSENINPTISVTGGTKPVGMLAGQVGGVGRHVIKDADLTGYAVSGGAYLVVTSITGPYAQVEIRKCKISATPALTSGTWPQGNGSLLCINVDSGNTDYKFHLENAYGVMDADATVFRDGGCSINGTPVSWKIVTTANANEFKPFATPLLQIWDTTTTSQTPVIGIAQASGATGLTDRTCWPTQDFPTSSTTTQFTFQSGRNAQPFVGTGSTWATDGGSTWTGLATPVLQTIGAGAFTAARAGLLEGRVFVGIATTTVYIDALIEGVT